ncbi:hypothetical protein NIES208_14075 [[Limnothrix rosea] IAM M-220]|nr:hypothetical protein NIES208_14075 [[Limnothrix rosea] IAM M-220]
MMALGKGRLFICVRSLFVYANAVFRKSGGSTGTIAKILRTFLTHSHFEGDFRKSGAKEG